MFSQVHNCRARGLSRPFALRDRDHCQGSLSDHRSSCSAILGSVNKSRRPHWPIKLLELADEPRRRGAGKSTLEGKVTFFLWGKRLFLQGQRGTKITALGAFSSWHEYFLKILLRFLLAAARAKILTNSRPRKR